MISKAYEGFLKSQQLWVHKQFGLRQFSFPTIDLKDLELSPVPLERRLGHQVEHIFLHLLKQSGQYDILAHSVQLKHGKETIGELDFLVRFRESACVTHIELTYKFYLVDPTISEPIHRLVGPNRSDMFFTKLEKTKHQQLPLLYHKTTAAVLKELELESDNIQQEVAFYAQLFVPFFAPKQSIRPLNIACTEGFWVDYITFETETFKDSTYYMPRKHEWLHLPHLSVTWENHFNTSLEININHIRGRSPMLWMLKPDQSIVKLFVTHWSST